MGQRSSRFEVWAQRYARHDQPRSDTHPPQAHEEQMRKTAGCTKLVDDVIIDNITPLLDLADIFKMREASHRHGIDKTTSI